MQIWFIGRTLASQAGKAGSIPVICLFEISLKVRESQYLSAFPHFSALKNMTEEGLLILRTEEDNRKNKRIYLTEKGKETVERIVVPLMDAERRALAAIGEQEAEIFLKTMKKHTEFFREEIEELTRQGDPA